MKKITFVDTETVTAIYVGNEIYTQDDAGDINIEVITGLIEVLEIDYEVEVVTDRSNAMVSYIDEHGELPETLREALKIINGE